MLIGFVGDVHGLVYHAIALVTTWQRKSGKKLDFVVQVGHTPESPMRLSQATPSPQPSPAGGRGGKRPCRSILLVTHNVGDA